MPRPQGSTLLAALGFLLLSLTIYRSVLPDPVTLAAYPAYTFDSLGQSKLNLVNLSLADRSMVVATLANNASRIAETPLSPFGPGQCFPTPAAHTLGEPMLVVSYLFASLHAFSGEPLLSYNLLLIVRLWMAGMTMFALARSLGMLAPAAFVAGAAFALQAPRLADVEHPYVYGDLWFPLVLLFTHRLMAQGRWRDFLLLVLSAALLVGESIYPVLISATLLAGYAPFLFFRYRHRIAQWLPQLLAAVALVGLAAWLFLEPWIAARDTWESVAPRGRVLAGVGALLPGGRFFVGPVCLALGLLSLALPRDRACQPDLRLASVTAGLLIAWTAVYRVQIPLTGLELPSLADLMRAWIPGADAVRGLVHLPSGVGFPAALLAGYGLQALLVRRPSRHTLAAAAAVVLVVSMLFVRAFGPATRPLFGRLLRVDASAARPPEADLRIHREHVHGPVVEVPSAFEDGQLTRLGPAHYLLLGAWNPVPTSTCYNSFFTPVQDQIAELAAALPAAHAARALAALGFETVLVHPDAQRAFPQDRFSIPATSAAGMERLAATDTLQAFSLPAPEPAQADWDSLELVGAEVVAAADHQPTRLRLRWQNGGNAIWRHPQPFLPVSLAVRWVRSDAAGSEIGTLRGLLPLALAPGSEKTLVVHTQLPAEAGRWSLEVTSPHGARLGEADLQIPAPPQIDDEQPKT